MKIRNIFPVFFILLWSSYTIAAVAPTNTRYLISSSQEHVNIKVHNGADKGYIAQVWIEDIEGNKITDTFSLLPSVFKIDANGDVLVRLLNKKKSLPQDRESLFYIVVQDVPPNEGNKENSIKIAYRSRIPLYYQPEKITVQNKKSRSGAVDNITWVLEEGVLQANNSSPYYFTIVTIDDEKLAGINIIPPFGTYKFESMNSLPKKYRYVDDFGAFVLINID
ncbi:molecular chaperone [Vibrio navarrensis]|uniref:fimbrial biogenesis chaperone n=1 Tax=Vibrio navarrensis TaxID=29495 RepID=UPI0018686F81|nr:molecular chaperone [Vibrio navarrensis]MBE3651674.1 hypothetical protein [Vibrio navarrensis]